jgi:hypothetical protein
MLLDLSGTGKVFPKYIEQMYISLVSNRRANPETYKDIKIEVPK